MTLAADTTTQMVINTADIGWPIVALVGVVLTFLALKWKFFPNVTGQVGDKKITIGDAPDHHGDVDQGNGDQARYVGIDRRSRVSCDDDGLVILAFKLTRKTLRVEREIEAAQYDLIDEEYVSFRSYVKKFNHDQDVLWRHVEDALISSAKNNHILKHVDLEAQKIDQLYMLKKVSFVKNRYIEIGVNWNMEIEKCIETFLHGMFIKFALESKTRTDELIDDLDTHKSSSGNPAIENLICVLKEEIGIEQ